MNMGVTILSLGRDFGLPTPVSIDDNAVKRAARPMACEK
jgi:hypothetical protein